MTGIRLAAGAAATLAVLAAVVTACSQSSEDQAEAPSPQLSDWTLQIGTDQADTTYGVAAAPNGDVVLTASTEGDLSGENQGQRDVYLARYTSTRELQWQIQIGGPRNDSPLGISVAPDDSTYVGGFTEGDFAATNQGSADVWLARFDADGNELWRRQFGSPGWDRGFDVAAFDGGAYITGYTAGALDEATDLGGFDGFAARFDADGNRQWVRHFGTDATDWGQGAALAPDDNGLFVTGYTEGDFGATSAGDKDVFVVRLEPDGDIAWVTQIGSEALDWTQGVAASDDGGVLVAGSTEGSLGGANAGGRDMLVIALDGDGSLRWIWQHGTDGVDTAFEVRRLDAQVLVTGSSDAKIAALSSLGGTDGVILSLNDDGSDFAITKAFTTDGDDTATGLDVTADGAVVWSGHTFGDYVGPNRGGSDLLLGFEAPDN